MNIAEQREQKIKLKKKNSLNTLIPSTITKKKKRVWSFLLLFEINIMFKGRKKKTKNIRGRIRIKKRGQ